MRKPAFLQITTEVAMCILKNIGYDTSNHAHGNCTLQTLQLFRFGMIGNKSNLDILLIEKKSQLHEIRLKISVIQIPGMWIHMKESTDNRNFLSPDRTGEYTGDIIHLRHRFPDFLRLGGRTADLLILPVQARGNHCRRYPAAFRNHLQGYFSHSISPILTV